MVFIVEKGGYTADISKDSWWQYKEIEKIPDIYSEWKGIIRCHR